MFLLSFRRDNRAPLSPSAAPVRLSFDSAKRESQTEVAAQHVQNEPRIIELGRRLREARQGGGLAGEPCGARGCDDDDSVVDVHVSGRIPCIPHAKARPSLKILDVPRSSERTEPEASDWKPA